jgi:hypothetical protein
MKILFVLSALIIYLFDCSGDESSTSTDQKQGTVFDETTDTLKKAEDVEKLIQDAAAIRDREMQKQGG